MAVPIIPNPKPQAKEVKPGKPAGWWGVDLKGSRDLVSNAILSSDIPDYEKVAIQARISAIAPAINFIDLHAHCFVQSGKTNIQVTITSSTALV